MEITQRAGKRQGGPGWTTRLMSFFLLVGVARAIHAGQTSSNAPATKPAAGAASSANAEIALPGAGGQTIDQVIAVVNGELILESDVDEERRFAAFQPFSHPGGSFTRDKAIQRLIDRTLILQQAKLRPGSEVKSTDVAKQIESLRKEIPACKRSACDTDAGWSRFLAQQGFTPEELEHRWTQRMDVLAYIENRFRMGITITPEEIKTYYQSALLPEYGKQKVSPPPLAAISDRIEEILLQEQVSKLLRDWLKSLRAQGTVQIMKPGEVAP